MCTHLLLEAEGLADQVVVLQDGVDVISGSPRELTRRYWPDVRSASAPTTSPSSTRSPSTRASSATSAPTTRRRAAGLRRPDPRPRRRARRRRGRVTRSSRTSRPSRTSIRGPPGDRPQPPRAVEGAASDGAAASGDGALPGRSHIWTVARTDLKQLAQARDYSIPMLILGGIFFVFVPTVLLFTITQLGSVEAVASSARRSRCSPSRRRPRSRATASRPAPATRWPSTSSPGGGDRAHHDLDRGRRGHHRRRARAGTGEFLAHSPAGIREIFLGKLAASLLPGYLTTIVGFGIYSLIVNTIVGPDVGGWFFPTSEWWVLMLWVVPPFLALTLSLVLRLSAKVKSTAAAQQASALVSLPLIMVAYSQATGSLYGGTPGLVHRRHRLGPRRHRPVAWRAGRHPRPSPRRRRRAVASS